MARLRSRLADLVVTSIAVALVTSPFIAQSMAGGSLVEHQVAVDEHVKASAVISIPYNGSFDASRSGKAVGSVAWDVFTSDPKGFKLSVNTDKVPALRDSGMGISIPDYNTSPSSWSVPAGGRRFGFSSTGKYSLDSYSDGSRWRGFVGREGVDVSRHRSGPTAMTRTTVMLASEMKSSLPSNANPRVWILATAVVNI